MTIVCDATALYGRFGGIETALFQTLRHLRELDTTNRYVVCVPNDCPVVNELTSSRWKVSRLPFEGAQKLSRILWQQLELPIFAQKASADLIYSPTYVAPLGATLPVVLGVPDLIALNQPRFATRANRWHYRAVMPRSLQKAARILVTTPLIARDVRRRAPDAMVRVVPLGVENEFLSPVSSVHIEAIREKYKLPDEFLLFVGNLEPKKNLPNLLRAVELLNGPPLVIAGGIKPWAGLEKLKSQVQFLGFVPRDDLPPLYAACSAFCFPSLSEGFGMPILEALACGANVVASSRVPIHNVAEVALTPNPRSPLAIAGAIESAMQFPRPHLKGIEFARPSTWERTARETLAVFQELAGR